MISFSNTLRLLANDFGAQGARTQLLTALRCGRLVATCERFTGLNAGDYNVENYPDSADNFALPAAFWGLRYWDSEGEFAWTPDRRPFDRWSCIADWEQGNFFLSGTWNRGTRPFSRRAYAAKLNVDSVRAWLGELGLGQHALTSGGRLSPDALGKWCAGWYAANGGGHDKAWAAYQIAHPTNGGRTDFRQVFAQVKASLAETK